MQHINIFWSFMYFSFISYAFLKTWKIEVQPLLLNRGYQENSMTKEQIYKLKVATQVQHIQSYQPTLRQQTMKTKNINLYGEVFLAHYKKHLQGGKVVCSRTVMFYHCPHGILEQFKQHVIEMGGYIHHCHRMCVSCKDKKKHLSIQRFI